MNRRDSVLASWALLLAAGAASAQTAPSPLPLLGGRFHVEAVWGTADGQTGSGTPVSLTSETGTFWFFSPTNTEVVVKVLDACSGSVPRFWVFAGGLTDVDVTLTVTDEANGTKKVYRNPAGTPFAPIQDTDAFATCADEHCGQGSFADLAASPRAEPELEGLAAFMSGSVAAPQAVYQRVVADVAAIRAANSRLTEVTFQPGYQLRSLNLEIDPAAATAIASRTYTAWDCLNRRYGMHQVRQGSSSNFVLLRFDKVVDMRRLIQGYEALPGVLSALPEPANALVPIPIPIPIHTGGICGRIEGEQYRYYFKLVGGAIFHYTTRPGAEPSLVGLFDVASTPTWIADASSCFSEQEVP